MQSFGLSCAITLFAGVLLTSPANAENKVFSIALSDALASPEAHEKLDGSGYWQGWHADQMSSFARILVVADIFDALRAKRPYRDSLPLDKVFSIMRADAPKALDLPCLEALIAAYTGKVNNYFYFFWGNKNCTVPGRIP